MALPRKKARRITVDGVAYCWQLRRRPTYCQGMGWSPLTYAVESAEAPGAALVVTTGRAHPTNWLDIPAAPLLPAEVAAAIRAARADGWTPDRPGRPFLLDRSAGFVPF